MKIVILASAEQDLQELRAYLVKNFSAATWHVTYRELKQAIRHLARFPLMGGIPEALESLQLVQYRQVLSGKNRIIYEVRGDTVFVHLIVDVSIHLPPREVVSHAFVGGIAHSACVKHRGAFQFTIREMTRPETDIGC